MPSPFRAPGMMSCQVGGTAHADPAGGRYARGQFQADLDAIRDAGITGVLGDVRLGGQQLTGQSGVADVTTGRPVDEHGYFRMGSDTKTFVAIVMLQLAQEGR